MLSVGVTKRKSDGAAVQAHSMATFPALLFAVDQACKRCPLVAAKAPMKREEPV